MGGYEKCIIGIDLGGTNTKVALVNKKGKIIAERGLITKNYRKKEELIDAIAGEVEKIMFAKGLKKPDLSGIGIGIPGLIDIERGVVHYLVNIAGWNNVPVVKLFEERLHIPAFVDNDVNVMALGEFTFGAGRGTRNMVCLTLGTGVGGAVIINGALYRGSAFSAGEIGHIPINADGPRCDCGGAGCLERYVGNQFIAKAAVDHIKKGQKTVIAKLVNGDLGKVTPEVISNAARYGDKLALHIWQDTGRYLGIALAGVVNLLNPEKIVIGGGVANAGKVLFDAVKETIKQRAMRLPAKTVKIVKAKLGEGAGVIGASVLVKTQIQGKRLTLQNKS